MFKGERLFHIAYVSNIEFANHLFCPFSCSSLSCSIDPCLAVGKTSPNVSRPCPWFTGAACTWSGAKKHKRQRKDTRRMRNQMYHHASARPIQKFIALPYSICSMASNFLHYQPQSLSVDFGWYSTFCRRCKLWSRYQVARMHSHQRLLSLYLLSANHWIQTANDSSIQVDPK